jgi:hypothetical protein
MPCGAPGSLGLFSKIVKDLDPYEHQPTLSQQIVDGLSAAIRKGFDTPDKLFFAGQHTSILSRVQMHQDYAKRAETIFGQL